MLRNLLHTLPSGQKILGTRYVGKLGSEILAEADTGPNGFGVINNDSIDPTKRYRVLITEDNFVPEGAVTLYENGSGFTTVSGWLRKEIYENNLLVPTSEDNKILSIYVGDLPEITLAVTTTEPVTSLSAQNAEGGTTVLTVTTEESVLDISATVEVFTSLNVMTDAPVTALSAAQQNSPTSFSLFTSDPVLSMSATVAGVSPLIELNIATESPLAFLSATSPTVLGFSLVTEDPVVSISINSLGSTATLTVETGEPVLDISAQTAVGSLTASFDVVTTPSVMSVSMIGDTSNMLPATSSLPISLGMTLDGKLIILI